MGNSDSQKLDENGGSVHFHRRQKRGGGRENGCHRTEEERVVHKASIGFPCCKEMERCELRSNEAIGFYGGGGKGREVCVKGTGKVSRE